MLIVDGVEHPLIFGAERTELLNRAKLTVSVLPRWYGSVLPHRFHMAAGNRCMVVSERELGHNPQLVEGRHYAAASSEKLADCVLYYLDHSKERMQIAENAYRAATEELTLGRSLSKIVALAEQVRTAAAH